MSLPVGSLAAWWEEDPLGDSQGADRDTHTLDTIT
jgi:hypothetical protein